MMRFFQIKSLALLVGLFGLAVGQAAAQSFPQWGSLKPGAYSVGFLHIQKYDYSRQVKPVLDFTGAATSETAYPVQIGLWYPAIKPAEGQALTYEDLLLLALKRESFTPVSSADREEVRNNVKAVTGLPEIRVAASDDLIKQTLETR